MSEEVVVFVTCPADAAPEMAQQLIESSVAACVNILPSIKSVYKWENKLTVDDGEALLVVKTNRALWADLQEKILSIHSYDVPEIICVPIVEGHQPYLDWLNKALKQPDHGGRQTL